MRMDGALQVFTAGAIFKRQHSLGDQLTGHRSDDVYTQDAIGSRIGNHLGKTTRGLHGARTATGHKREHAELDGKASRTGLLFGLTDPANLRGGVNNRGHHIEVGVAIVASDQVTHHHALFLGLVRQHRATHAVAHGIYALDTGVAVRINFYEAPRIDPHAGAFSQQPFSKGLATNSDNQLVELRLLLTCCVGVEHINAGLADLGRRNLGTQAHFKTLFGELLKRFFGHLAIGYWQKISRCF